MLFKKFLPHIFFVFILSAFQFSSGQSPDWEWANATRGIGAFGNTGSGTVLDNDRNVYTTGYFDNDTLYFGNLMLANPEYHISFYIVKYDFEGNTVWAKSISGYFQVNPKGPSIAIDNENNLYMAGSFIGDTLILGYDTLFNTGIDSDIFLTKFDSSGNLLWAKNFPGNSDDEVYDITTDPTGNIFLTGYYQSSQVNFDNVILTHPFIQQSPNSFIAKLDSGGHGLWARRSDWNDWANISRSNSVIADPSGNSYITGYFDSDTVFFGNIVLTSRTRNYNHIFLVKYDAAGNELWAKCLGDTNDVGYDLATDESCNLYITGQFSDSLYMDHDTLVPPFSSSLFVARYDSSGEEQWAKSAGWNNEDKATCIVADNYGNAYITGYFGGSINDIIIFDEDTLHTNSGGNVFVVKYNSFGNVDWAKSVGGIHWGSEGHGLAVNDLGNVYVTGVINDTITPFDYDTLRGAFFGESFTGKISFVTINTFSSVICKGDSVQLSATGADSYSWSPITGLSSSVDSIIWAFPDTTTIYTVTGIKNGIPSTTHTLVTVNPLPLPSIISVQNDSLFSGTWFNIQWFRNDTLIPGAIHQLYIVPIPVTYYQCYNVRSQNNYHCYSFSDTLCFNPVGIPEYANDKEFHIYPNPATNHFEIVYDVNSNSEMEIFNSLGMKVFSAALHGQLSIDCTAFPSGIYFVNIRSNNLTIAKKIILSHE